MQYGTPSDERGLRGRKFIGVMFECCSIYGRVYYSESKKGYYGACPICRRRVNVKVDPEKGIDARFFRLTPGSE